MLRLVYPSLGGNDPTAVGFLSFCRYIVRTELS